MNLWVAVHVTEREMFGTVVQVLIHDNCAVVGGFDAGVFQTQTLGGGACGRSQPSRNHLHLGGAPESRGRSRSPSQRFVQKDCTARRQ